MEDKTFTQDEVNKIISERLKDERAKLQKEHSAIIAEYQRKEAMMNAKADWSRRGLPVDLLDSIDISAEGNLERVTSILEKMTVSRPMTGGFSGRQMPDVNDMPPSEQQSIRSAMGLDRKD